MRAKNTKRGIAGKLSGAGGLISIAAKVGQLAYQASREPEGYRMAGRLNRLVQFQISELAEEGIATFAEVHVYLASIGDLLVGGPSAFYSLQAAIAQVSYRTWEDLWNDKHPESFGKAWDGQDFGLMAVWRERVREMIEDCHLHAVFAMATEEYFAKPIGAGASEEDAEELAEWLADVKYEGTTPSTQVVSRASRAEEELRNGKPSANVRPRSKMGRAAKALPFQVLIFAISMIPRRPPKGGRLKHRGAVRTTLRH
jgi:hypothetical protein